MTNLDYQQYYIKNCLQFRPGHVKLYWQFHYVIDVLLDSIEFEGASLFCTFNTKKKVLPCYHIDS